MKAKNVSLLNASARNAIVAAYTSALSQTESTGSLVTQVCDRVRSIFKGAPISDDDRASIIAGIASARGWGKNVLKQRSSEVNAVLKSYSTLPDAIESFRDKAKACQWHNALKMARKIAKGASVKQAVAFAISNKGGAIVPPSGRVASALKAWFKSTPAKRKAIIAAAELLNIKLGVKLDA